LVVEPEALDFIDDDETSWERQPLSNIAKAGKLSAYKHRDFWHPMDTLRDRNYLEALWQRGEAPWKVW
jgi:glucose-1-phosphate cytidylyltransferase